jgi:hypothetical protein
MSSRKEIDATLERVRRRYAPEPRHAVFEAEVRRRGRRHSVRLTTSEPAAAVALERALGRGSGVSVACTVLPDSELDGATHGIVRVAVTPVRREPSVRSEQVSQEVMGALVEALRRDGEWLLVRGEDGYIGWVHEGALDRGGREWARDWARRLWHEGALALDGVVEGEDGGPVARLPWGSRVLLDEAERVVLPSGLRGELVEGTVVPVAELVERYPPTASALVETAAGWLGVPYLWGGRTRWGADCSGFVQAVLGLHGTALARDSDLQAKAGAAVKPAPGFRNLRPGDLVFFRSHRSRRITHVGLSAGRGLLWHAAESNGEVRLDDLCADSGLGAQLARRVAAVRRVLPS